MVNRDNGSPYACGQSDAYYHRRPSPHRYEGLFIQDKKRVEAEDMTPEEIKEYWQGFDDLPNSERKQW